MFTYVGLGVFPIIIVSIILISLTQNTVQDYIHQRNLETARRASNEILLFIKVPQTILSTISATSDIVNMERFAQSRLINKIKEENPIFQKIFVLDSTGTVISTTSFGEESLNLASEPYFQFCKENKEYISDVYFTPSRFPAITLAEPIRKFNKFIGALVAEIDLKSIWDLVDNITIGKTGNAFLLSKEGIVIAHKEKEKVLERENYSKFAFFESLMQGYEGITRFEMDGQEMIAAYVPIRTLNWGIVIQQTQEEAFTLARQMQVRVIILVALTLIIAFILGVLGVKRLTRPLEELVRGVRLYAQGNLDHRIELHRQDELAELAHEFNSMAGSLKKNQQELQRMERLAALSRFASMVSHEIRNPLNSMNINMQILKRLIHQQDVAPEKKVKYLNVLSAEISRMNELVTNFLTIARPPELNLIRTELHQILEEVLLVQAARAQAEGIRIRREYASESATGLFDHNQLKQVFHNIIVNAFEAMTEGGELVVRTQIIRKQDKENHQNHFIRITFQDTGPGIPASKIKEVFDFYFTTKRTGTGLGLAIAKQIVEAHQGKIYITSEEGKGTQVHIELPIECMINEEDSTVLEG